MYSFVITMSKNVWEITKCRVCGNTDLHNVITLGDLHMSNFVERHEASLHTPYPLELVRCTRLGCGLLQLRHTVSGKVMYRNYWYRSGVNQTMTEHLKGIARVAASVVNLGRGDVVVDIGANDGTLLRSYNRDDVTTVGFEPAKNLMSFARKEVTHIFNDFFSGDLFKKRFSKKAKIVTAIAMFYDLDDPHTFVSDVKKVLDKDGVFIIQMMDLVSMLKLNAFDNICHEHLEYYSLESLEYLLKGHKLEIFDLETNDINGGSLRTYIRHCGSKVGNDRRGSRERIAKWRVEEKRLKLQDPKTYEAFGERVEGIRGALIQFLQKEKKRGRKIYVYGASTKGNTLLQYFGLNDTHIDAAAERNSIKWGKVTLGSNIPIVSEEHARQSSPHYFLVLPWHFLQEFVERERAFLLSGGKFITPLPEFTIIDKKILD